MCRSLDEHVGLFGGRPLEGDYPCLTTRGSSNPASERFLGQPERTSLCVLADRPSLPWVDHASPKRLDPLERLGEIAYREVGQRKRIARTTSAKMDANRRRS